MSDANPVETVYREIKTAFLRINEAHVGDEGFLAVVPTLCVLIDELAALAPPEIKKLWAEQLYGVADRLTAPDDGIER